MDQEHRIVFLQSLYDFAKSNRENPDAVRLERTPLGREYCRLCDVITEIVDDAKGFYVWGEFDEKSYWHTIYLGKAGFSKTNSLRKRLNEELKDERCFVWRSIFTSDQLHLIRDRIHSGKYRAGWDRAMKKANTTHIAWVPAFFVDDSEIETVEADLIEALNPFANIRRLAPPNKAHEHANRVFDAFRRTIRAARTRRSLPKAV